MARSAHARDDSVRRLTPVSAPQDQHASLVRLLRSFESAEGELPVRFVDRAGEEIEVPQVAIPLFHQVIEVLARGDAITIVPVGKELTTQQAAQILNVSRQYVVRLLDDGRIPYRKVGTHRRVRIEDLLAFKRQRDRDRMASLDDLSELSQTFGGYDEIPESE